ncbi:LysR substrate-binding domain-containing protein [Aureimonas glaciei]|uniref:LysR family transcriptional regulator n=1 Tax=Aureimonas glaciei TaxID=1776957 RepID=A0A916YA41_9HYPH|nr:LysR substrate-binding domain-containing protein [Aureimonas glaciei]GGD35913.1 LysR family transcriptional regulator [Aureimonas glaciei]
MRIPSTQALRSLESFARHGSVWRAAEELNLTRSAVSHQLRLLERDLGFDLLRRLGKGVALTPQGRRYAGDVRKALTLIGDAAIQYGDRGIRGALNVSCTPGLASLWLCTHLGEFLALYPDVALKIATPRRLDDVTHPDMDLFIAFGDGVWPGHSVELLAQVEFTPLCSPGLLNRIGGIAVPEDIFRATLLHLGDHGDWTQWFAAAGYPSPESETGVVFSDMNLVLAAAAAGQGIAMGDELTCRAALDAGQLVRPFDLALRSARAYYLVVEHHRTGNPALLAFCDWLRTRLTQSAPGMRPA